MKATRTPLPDFETPPIPTMPRGRICAENGCSAVLSVYNPEPYCSLHEHAHDDDPEVPDGYRRCRRCLRILPLTADFFHVQHERFYNICKECRNSRRREQYWAVPDPGQKRCPRCGKTKALTRQFWYVRKNTSGGWMAWCKVCTADYARDRARRLSQAKTGKVF